jgi:hypothetical protein
VIYKTFRYRTVGARLNLGPVRLMANRVPDGPALGWGRIATTGPGPVAVCGRRPVLDHQGVSLVVAGISFSVLRRTGVMCPCRDM